MDPVEELKELQAKFKEAIESRDQAKAKLREQESRLASLESAEAARSRELEEARNKVEQEKLSTKGEYDKALGLANEKFSKDIGSIRSSFERAHKPMIIKSIASGIEKVTPQALNDLPNMVGQFIRLNDSFEAVVVDESGKEVKDEQLKPIAPVDFIKKFVNDRPYMLLDSMPAGQHKSKGDVSGGKALSMDDVVSNPKLAKEWFGRDPEGYDAAKKEYYSPDAVRARLINKK